MAKYKVGDKFVIEIESIEKRLPYPYIMKNSEPYSDCELDKLERFTDSYNEGAEDAWELAKLITIYTYNGGLTSRDLIEIFGTDSRDDIFRNNTYKEAKAKFDAWEKSKEEIKVGDVVNIKNHRNASGIVFAINGEWCSLAWSDGYCGSYLATDIIKTGENHADEVTALIGLLK